MGKYQALVSIVFKRGTKEGNYQIVSSINEHAVPAPPEVNASK